MDIYGLEFTRVELLYCAILILFVQICSVLQWNIETIKRFQCGNRSGNRSMFQWITETITVTVFAVVFVCSIAIVKHIDSQNRNLLDRLVILSEKMIIRDDEPTQGKNSTPHSKTKL